VTSGSRTLKDAISEAMRDWVTNVGDTYYLLGSVLGSHPYPMMVRDFHKVIGEEARRQILEAEGRLPDTIFACVGGGSNAIGIFHAFLGDEKVKLSASKPADAARNRRTCGALSRRALPECCKALTASAAGCRRPDRADAFRLGGPGLRHDRAGARLAARSEPRRIHRRVRRRSARRGAPALAHRRHHSGARIGARGGRSGAPRALRPGGSSWSMCRAAATRTSISTARISRNSTRNDCMRSRRPAFGPSSRT
jgi:hypothetical protein